MKSIQMLNNMIIVKNITNNQVFITTQRLNINVHENPWERSETTKFGKPPPPHTNIDLNGLKL